MFGKAKKEETFNVKGLYVVQPCKIKLSECKKFLTCGCENGTIGYIVVKNLTYWFDDVLTGERYAYIRHPFITDYIGQYVVKDLIPLYSKLKDSKKTIITRSEIIEFLNLMNHQEYNDIIIKQIYDLSEKVKLSDCLVGSKKVELINRLSEIAASYVDEVNDMIDTYKNGYNYLDNDEKIIKIQNEYMVKLININMLIEEKIDILGEYNSLVKKLKR